MENKVETDIITPLEAILVRAAKTYMQTLIGLLTAGMTGMDQGALGAGDFFHKLKVCAGLAVASGVMSILTNVSAFLTALGDRYPMLKT